MLGELSYCRLDVRAEAKKSGRQLGANGGAVLFFVDHGFAAVPAKIGTVPVAASRPIYSQRRQRL